MNAENSFTISQSSLITHGTMHSRALIACSISTEGTLALQIQACNIMTTLYFEEYRVQSATSRKNDCIPDVARCSFAVFVQNVHRRTDPGRRRLSVMLLPPRPLGASIRRSPGTSLESTPYRLPNRPRYRLLRAASGETRLPSMDHTDA